MRCEGSEEVRQFDRVCMTKFKYGVYAARVKPGFEPVMFKAAKTLEQAIRLMEAMIRLSSIRGAEPA